jgi:hypothetical protein
LSENDLAEARLGSNNEVAVLAERKEICTFFIKMKNTLAPRVDLKMHLLAFL